MHKSVIVALLAGLFALGLVNFSIYQKEALLADGEIVLLELAPVDPRSLMQGDYMALRFGIETDIRAQLRQQGQGQPERNGLTSRDGFVVVTLGDNLVAGFSRIAGDTGQQMAANERLIQFRIRNGVVKFATNGFFFQEGTAQLYERARYGEFRLGAGGDILLTGLRGETLEKLGPPKSSAAGTRRWWQKAKPDSE